MSCDRKIGPYKCCSVVQGDCLELMKALPDGCVDAVITDPPYGVGENAHRIASRTKLAATTDYGDFEWDSEPASAEEIAEVRRVSTLCIIWGGNYFDLPPRRGWLVWDKQNSGNFADCELAWTNLPISVRIFRFMWNGMIRAGEQRGIPRVHPTQKPRELMTWCIGFVNAADTILDPFCGSGTTLVAAAKLGRHYLGFEISPEYVEIARKRLALVEAQPTLFEPKAEQQELGL